VAIAIAANATAPSAADPSAARTVTFFEAQGGGTFRFIDQPPPSPVSNSDSPRARFSTGDQAYWTGVILDRSGGKPIGRVFGAETVMRGTRFPNVTNMIHAIFRLNAGAIVVDAVVDENHPARVRGAVTGGTGAYEGARGTFTTSPGARGNADTLRLLP
jgi:hypothetical protein